MTHVVVTCPECNYSKVINGRGRCRCGAYLIHHQKTPKYFTDEERVYVWENGSWRRISGGS